MSVRLHEAVCFDSTKYRLDWRDDFWGDSLDARWNAAGAGSAAVVDAQDGGVCRLTTGTTTNNAYLLSWNNIRSLHVDKKITMEARIKLNVADATVYSYIALAFDTNNMVLFYHRSADINVQIQTTNGAAITRSDSNILKDANFHIYRIECFPAGEVHFYYDDVECTNSPITTNIPSDAGDYLQPYFYIATNADTDPATSMDIDYVWVHQTR